jgi:S-adenosyl-L-methionine hydrolase (adenosine-forming)
MRSTITLTTDFGTRDGYVGAIKGVIRSIAPDARLLDISHDIGHGRVRQASFLLDNILEFFPAGTIHLVVVDPTVGSARRALIVEYRDCLLVGPDNGVFETAYRDSDAWNCYEISESSFMLPNVSDSFHGRDIFAPVAAHLAVGVAPVEFGQPLEDPVRQSGPRKKIFGDGRIVGSVIHSDRFGNLITDITAEELDTLGSARSNLRISLCGKIIRGVSSHYAQAGPGKLIALVGGTGRLEVAVNLNSAADVLGTPSLDAEVTVYETSE